MKIRRVGLVALLLLAAVGCARHDYNTGSNYGGQAGVNSNSAGPADQPGSGEQEGSAGAGQTNGALSTSKHNAPPAR